MNLIVKLRSLISSSLVDVPVKYTNFLVVSDGDHQVGRSRVYTYRKFTYNPGNKLDFYRKYIDPKTITDDTLVIIDSSYETLLRRGGVQFIYDVDNICWE
jgi:hypothetical protein